MVHFSKWMTWLTLAILAAGILFSLPNLLTQQQADALPGWLPHKRISLGLDLQGGSHLLFQVDIDAVVRDRLESDCQSPPLRASVGVALYPRDGETGESLLGAADRLLYQDKAHQRTGLSPPSRPTVRRRGDSRA